MRLLTFLVLFFALLAPGAAEEAPKVDLRPLAARIVREVVQPGQAEFTGAARAAAEAWRDACGPSAVSRKVLAARYRALAEAWWRIEVIRFGPIVEDFRAERVNFWPDRRNATTRGLAALLDAAKPEATAETIRGESAAVQGLPVLERLIFDTAGEPSARGCAVGRAVTENIRIIAEAVEEEWVVLAERVAADEEPAREMVTRLVTDLLTGFETLIETKLAALGKTGDAARPERLEARRAGLEATALARSLDGMARLAAALVAGREEGAVVTATLDTARSIAADLPEPLAPRLAEPGVWRRSVLLRDALRAAQEVAGSDLPALVGITVGFNSRDGD